MEFKVKTFKELTTFELYEILKSRTEVFLLEQKIICQDLDDMDKISLHCFFTDGERVRAYLRAFKSGEEEAIIGRVLTLEHKKGMGSLLMEKSIDEIKNYFKIKKICVHAQKQAEKFYEKMGFKTVSGEYLEEGVVHVTMEREV